MSESADQGKVYVGSTISVSFDAGRCLHFAECVHGLPRVFDTGQRPWIQPDQAEAEAVARVVERCPSGALRYQRTDGDTERPPVPTTAVRVPGGPLLLHGDLQVVRPLDDETPEVSSETRVAACACGRSAHWFRCDNSCKD